MKDPVGFKVTREQVVNNYTDDGKLVDTRWNSRHTITPSFYNGDNHNFYKVKYPQTHLSLPIAIF
jgi:hypothetical protein